MYRLSHILVAFFLLLGGFSYAQQAESGHPLLDDFDVFEIDGEVFISVTISAGNTCNGIYVQRSEDNLLFNQVGHVGGICGSSSTSVTYNFTDDSPVKNAKNHYRVELGGNGYTGVVSVEIINTQEFGFQVRPNPANERAIIYFDNGFNEDFQIEVFDLGGRKVFYDVTSINQFDINTSILNNGIYVFNLTKISGSQNPVVGKLVVKH